MPRNATFSAIRVGARLTNAFVLDMIKMGGYGRDATDGLLLLAITQANLAPLIRDPVLQRTYATVDQPPPDESRRPVSMNALSNSLGIPFETVRRRVASLAKDGVVEVTSRGVYLPQATVSSPFYRLALEVTYRLVGSLYHRLRDLGLLANLPEPAAGAQPFDAPPVRLVARLATAYLLRLAEPLKQHIGDMVTGLILMDIIGANTESLSDRERGTEEAGEAGFVTNDHRKPIKVAEIALRLSMPQETVRRHVNRLVRDEQCVRVDEGYIVPAKVLARGPFVEFMQLSQSHLLRMFTAMAEYGVLADWDRQRPGLQGAA
ncbi:hypothetical protein [Phenylobacterium sp.]|uniref:hypothetical protein n=1 Tax=Phenylobacterium sp. TaxID=1871053 RepID=UPI003982F5FB